MSFETIVDDKRRMTANGSDKPKSEHTLYCVTVRNRWLCFLQINRLVFGSMSCGKYENQWKSHILKIKNSWVCHLLAHRFRLKQLLKFPFQVADVLSYSRQQFTKKKDGERFWKAYTCNKVVVGYCLLLLHLSGVYSWLCDWHYMPIRTASANSAKLRGIRTRTYIEALLW